MSADWEMLKDDKQAAERLLKEFAVDSDDEKDDDDIQNQEDDDKEQKEKEDKI